MENMEAAIMENMEESIVKASASAINLKVGVLYDHGASLYVLFSIRALRTLEATFQARNSIGSTPASFVLA